MSEIRLRKLEAGDYNRGYLKCLENLTEVGNISEDNFKKRLNMMLAKGDYSIIVAVMDDQIIGSGTAFFEYKFIHRLAIKAHIEDIVVSKEHQGKGIGKKIVNELVSIAKDSGCYKVALVTAPQTVPFYEKCGFTEKERELVMYLEK